jgi:hypothetical protein
MTLVPTCFGSRRNHHQGAVLCLAKNTNVFVYFYCKSMYSYCCLCILIVRPCTLNVVYVLLLLSMYTYCCLRIRRRGYPD